MAKLKLIGCLMFLVMSFTNASSQVYQFQATGFSVLEKTAKGSWGKWSDLQKTSLVISLDTNKNRIIVYSQEIQLYNIITYGEKEENEFDIIYPFICEDTDGERFTISIITRKTQGNRKQLYINQKDIILVYNIVHMKT